MPRRTVIKGVDTSKTIRTVVERHVMVADTMQECNERLVEAEMEAKRIVAEAKREAEGIRASAQRDAERLRQEEEAACQQLRQQTYEEAHAEATADAYKAVSDEVADLFDNLRSMTQEAQACLQQILHDYEPELVRLALAMCEEIVAVQQEADDALVQRVLAHALEHAGDREAITIRVNAEDFDRVQRYLPDLQERFPDVEKVSVDIDPRVDRGGCLVQTRLGTVDARLAQQQARLREAMLEA